ncbi:MAG: DUF1232 domain-containing protein [Acidobacteriota bacterium]
MEALTELSERIEDDELPSGGLLSFYDRLRARIAAFIDSKAGSLAPATTSALLLIPDVFVLLMRLALDKEVPKSSRMLIGSALAYFVLPLDILPEAILGPTGYMDDLVLALAVLAQAFSRDLEPWAERYWSGSRPLRRVVADILDTSHHLLGADVHGKLRSSLKKRGVDLDRVSEDASDAEEPAVSPV